MKTIICLAVTLFSSAVLAEDGMTAKSLFYATDGSVMSVATAPASKTSTTTAAVAPAKTASGTQVAAAKKGNLGAGYFIRLKQDDGTVKDVLASRTFPIVFAPVTDPVAAKLVPSMEHGDRLMAGVSNLPDLDATCDFVKTLIPSAKRLGIVYNPGDDSDVAFVNRLEKVVAAHGLEWVKVGIDNANDIAPRVQSLQGRADALFVPASSLLQPAGAAIASVTNRIKLPVFNSNTAQVVNHQFLAALSVDWGRIGINAGRMAAEILKGKKPADLPVSVPTRADHEMKISAQRLADLGIALPDALKNCNCVVK